MRLKLSRKIHGRLPLTPNNFYYTFQVYLVTWLNIITKERGLYPESSYEERNSFNLRVPYSRHPKVNEWFEELVSDIMDDLAFKNVQVINLIIFDEYSKHIAETYAIDMKEFLHVEKDYYDKEIKDVIKNWEDIYDEFRANLHSLQTEIRKLPRLPGHITDEEEEASVLLQSTPILTPTQTYDWRFNVVVHTHRVSMSTKWILQESATRDMNASDMNMNDDDDDDDDDDPNTIPLQLVDAGPLIFYSSIHLTHP